ncbi:MAG: efflux RND transporter periplasmic adaptor subunit [Gammaproteobacteria bacterium]
MKLLLSLFIAFSICWPLFAEADAQSSVLVQTMPLRQRVMTSHITGFGTLTPEPDATVNLNFPIGGRVDRVLVNPGQRVHKNDLLLTVTSDPASSLSYTQAKNALDYARAELKREKKLFAQQLTTRSSLDNAAKNLKDAKQAMAMQKRLGAGITRNKLTAPIDGVVIAVKAVPGDRFSAGTNLVEIANVTTLRARLGVEPSDSRFLQPGQKVMLSSVLDSNLHGEGQVVWVAGQINPKTQLVDVSIRTQATGFAPGERVRGEIETASKRQYAVPRRAVLKDTDGAYLYQVVDKHAHRINVKTGMEEGNWVAVQGPFIDGAPVVTLGNYELHDGGLVRVQAQ